LNCRTVRKRNRIQQLNDSTIQGRRYKSKTTKTENLQMREAPGG
jgi:hypothetical protein